MGRGKRTMFSMSGSKTKVQMDKRQKRKSRKILGGSRMVCEVPVWVSVGPRGSGSVQEGQITLSLVPFYSLLPCIYTFHIWTHFYPSLKHPGMFGRVRDCPGGSRRVGIPIKNIHTVARGQYCYNHIGCVLKHWTIKMYSLNLVKFIFKCGLRSV